jgi:Ca-activated chloride channel family protein
MRERRGKSPAFFVWGCAAPRDARNDLNTAKLAGKNNRSLVVCFNGLRCVLSGRFAGKLGLAFVLSLVAPQLAETSFAQDASAGARTIIVMDGSGSMWGQINGVPKLEIARETVAEVLKGLPQEREIGLVAYGHRTRGDCSDIEIMVPPEAGTAAAISEAVNTMRFQGRTPLTDAVRRAAEELRFTENPATVVLVTDGIETCNADPCALGKELEQSGVEFTAHVVGFGLTRQEGLELSCLARNTGGSYFDASDREGLGKALDQAIRTAAPAETPATAAPEPVQPEATLDAADSAAITSAVEVTWTATRSERDYIDVAPVDAPAFEWASWVELGDSDTVMLRMPPEPGDYVIRYIAPDAAEPVVASRPIKVIEGDFVLDGPLTVQVGESFRINWRGPEGEENYIDIMKKGSTATENEPSYAWTRDGNPAELTAPIAAGEYQLRFVVQGESARAVGLSVPLNVIEGRAEIEAAAEVAPGAEFPVRARGPQNSRHWIDIVTPGFSEFSGEIGYFYLGESDAPFTEGSLTAPAEPGSYDLRYVIEGMKGGRRVITRRTITVSPGASADVSLAPVE